MILIGNHPRDTATFGDAATFEARVVDESQASHDIAQPHHHGARLRSILQPSGDTTQLDPQKPMASLLMTSLNRNTTVRACVQASYPEYSRANSYPWSPLPPRRARPGPGPHTATPHSTVLSPPHRSTLNSGDTTPCRSLYLF